MAHTNQQKLLILVSSIFLLFIIQVLLPSTALASGPTPIFGTITNPISAAYPGGYTEATTFLNYLIRLITIIAGLWAFANFALAGFQYIQSAGNPEGITKSWEKIYQSIIGLAIVILAYALAALLGLIFFGDATAILEPSISGPV